MAIGDGGRSGMLVAQAGVIVLLTTLALTAAILGLVGLVSGRVTGLEQRLPFYVLATAIAFLGGILTFEAEFTSGRRVLTSATLTAVGTALLVGSGGEGVAYVVQHPSQVASSSLVFYVLSAGLIGFGLGYLGLSHWAGYIGDGSRL